MLSWSAVEGAIGYDIHVDKVDGSSQDDTVNSTSLTPVIWYGQGIWRWKVRARFYDLGRRNGAERVFAAADGAPHPRAADRRHGEAEQLAASCIAWNAQTSAKRYQVDFSTTDGFSSTFGGGITDHTSWAPDVGDDNFKKGGTIYWRVAVIDEGGNRGASRAASSSSRARCRSRPAACSSSARPGGFRSRSGRPRGRRWPRPRSR